MSETIAKGLDCYGNPIRPLESKSSLTIEEMLDQAFAPVAPPNVIIRRSEENYGHKAAPRDYESAL